jgi:hypothetical protein
MKYLSLLLLFLVPCMASADDASHRQAALKLLDEINAKGVMRDAFMNIVDVMASSQANAKMPPAEAADMKQAVVAWFDEDFKWDDLKAQLADVYVKSFTEDELNQLGAFYQTPLGKKTLSALPEVMKEGAMLGQQYALTKQSLLMVRLQKVQAKYEGAGPSSPAATTPASP